jgi:hypothetical protein
MRFNSALVNCSVAILVCLFSANFARAAALWTFETSLPATAGPFPAELGPDAATSNASGFHTGAAVYSNPAGNGSAHSFSANTWAVGDYYQFTTPRNGTASLPIAWDQTSSGTGPAHYALRVSNDGTNFVDVTGFSSYTVQANAAPNPVWNATTASSIYSFSTIMTGLTGSTVTVRMVDLDTVAASGGTVAVAGTDRIDNVNIGGVVPEPTTLAMAGIGLLGLVSIAVRRKMA